MKALKSSLEQWRTLQAVIDYGGYAQAAEHLHRSQSSVSYAISKLQQQLGVPLLHIEGRKAQLTESGEMLLRRSRQLLKEAATLENMAASLGQGWEPEVRLVFDAAFPSQILMRALKQFAPLSHGTRVQLKEVVLSGADEALTEGEADIVIGASVPQGFLGEMLVEIEFVAVAHPAHTLHQLGRDISMNDLSKEMQVVIRDSGIHHQRDSGWLGAEHRWTVTNFTTAIEALINGLGFAWIVTDQIEKELTQGLLKPLPLREGQKRYAHLYLVFGQSDNVGPATRLLADIIHQCVRTRDEEGLLENI